MTTKTQPIYQNLGLKNHGVKGSMWSVEGSNGEQHYISVHLNPNQQGELLDKEIYLLMCSCRSFTIGIPASNTNPFVEPCKHIEDFDESEVDIDILDGSSQSQRQDGVLDS